MLVLNRKSSQSIMIGEDIEVVILEVKGDNVKIGVNAPRNVKVFRQELLAEVKAENQRAASQASAEAQASPEAAAMLLKQAFQKPQS